jgi:hypothetical protein
MEKRNWDNIPRDEARKLVESIAYSGQPVHDIIGEITNLCSGNVVHNPDATPPALIVPHAGSRFLVQILAPVPSSDHLEVMYTLYEMTTQRGETYAGYPDIVSRGRDLWYRIHTCPPSITIEEMRALGDKPILNPYPEGDEILVDLRHHQIKRLAPKAGK